MLFWTFAHTYPCWTLLKRWVVLEGLHSRCTKAHLNELIWYCYKHMINVTLIVVTLIRQRWHLKMIFSNIDKFWSQLRWFALHMMRWLTMHQDDDRLCISWCLHWVLAGNYKGLKNPGIVILIRYLYVYVYINIIKILWSFKHLSLQNMFKSCLDPSWHCVRWAKDCVSRKCDL